MNDDELGRLLSGAFDAQARADVPGTAVPPPPRFAEETTAGDLHPAVRPRRRTRLLAPLLAAAAVVALVSGGAVIANLRGHSAPQPVGKGASSGRSVHIHLLNADGTRVGVGMPVIAYFSRDITSGVALSRATVVTVNGLLQRAAWYFEPSEADPNYPIEGHLRLQRYWPAHAAIHVAINAKDVSAGPGMRFDDSLTLDFKTGAAIIATVDDANHTMSVKRDGRRIGPFPVSLGSAATPTRSGVKVVMEQGGSVCLKGPGYRECGVKDAQRLTYGGEFLHAAPWNLANIGQRDTSNGSTNLRPADAARLFRVMEIGDVVDYPNANGTPMQLGAGYGDWNVSWSAWLTGGSAPTR